jgi:hypothetical protein
MKWREYGPLGDDSNNRIFPVLYGAEKVLINDDNLKPDWVEHPAQYTEFHVKRNKDTLLVVVGESWTYGESLPKIASALQRYDIISQLEHCFGPKLAVTLNADLYQYAVPGNCNLYMSMGLERILDHVSTMGYKKIYVCMQITECGRDNSVVHKYPNSILSSILKVEGENCTFDEWLADYDEAFFNHYDSLLKKYKKCNIEGILWKNFCSTNTARRDYAFKIIETSWIQYSARVLGVKLEMPKFFVAGWVENMQTHFKRIKFDTKMILNELDKVDKSLTFINGNPLHNNHPTLQGHTVWAQYLARQSGWVDGI